MLVKVRQILTFTQQNYFFFNFRAEKNKKSSTISDTNKVSNYFKQKITRVKMWDSVRKPSYESYTIVLKRNALFLGVLLHRRLSFFIEILIIKFNARRFDTTYLKVSTE